MSDPKWEDSDEAYARRRKGLPDPDPFVEAAKATEGFVASWPPDDMVAAVPCVDFVRKNEVEKQPHVAPQWYDPREGEHPDNSGKAIEHPMAFADRGRKSMIGRRGGLNPNRYVLGYYPASPPEEQFITIRFSRSGAWHNSGHYNVHPPDRWCELPDQPTPPARGYHPFRKKKV